MPGNEETVIKFLVKSLHNDKKINLPVIGNLNEVSMPIKDGKKIIRQTSELINFSSNDRYKKADVYLNNFGVSLKEESAPLYNKIQRKHLTDLINYLFPSKSNFISDLFAKLDNEIEKVNKGSNRDIQWNKIFSEDEFLIFLEFLMMKGYADTKVSLHQADLILIAPKKISFENLDKIKIFSFKDYFLTYKNKIVIAARRIWIGSKSKSENKRALSMSKHPDNKKWIYKNISGKPRNWDTSFPSQNRREIFYLNLNT